MWFPKAVHPRSNDFEKLETALALSVKEIKEQDAEIERLESQVKEVMTCADDDAEEAIKQAKENDQLRADLQSSRDQVERYRQALESIASNHRPRHSEEEYWQKINHEQCATVLATDTKIAREALSPDGRPSE